MDIILTEYNIFDSYNSNGSGKILLKVKAGAKKNSIDGMITIENKNYLKLSIKAPPYKDKANEMIIEYLAFMLDLPKSHLKITSGVTSKFKVVSLVK